MNGVLSSIGAPECVWDAKAILGECPVWDGQCLWWTDIKGPTLHRYNPGTRVCESWEAPKPIGSFVTETDGSLLAAMQSGFVRIVPSNNGTLSVTPICSPEMDLPGNRFNDGKRAPDGSFWAGTMDATEQAATGAWWRLDATGSAIKLDSGYAVTNGPAFDAVRGRVYLTDSARQTVFMADLVGNGQGFTDKRVFLQFGAGDGYPDGMEVDATGCLWIAFWDGARIACYSPDGDLLQSIAMPVARPTSIAFAPELNAMFVTSARSSGEFCAVDGGVFSISKIQPNSTIKRGIVS